ncbi:MAG: hypothetical protein HWN67_09310 [Candidatus Helarchaeota archaeon]|nr:hypothetical protein [Candidatus Helarchaeota archaeon]
MLEWKTLDFKQKTILFCGLILIVFCFIPWWIHPNYYAFWIPLIGIYIGAPFNNFVLVNFWFYIFVALTLFGGILCFFEQKNHKLSLYGAIIATVASFIFMVIFIAGTSDLNRFYFVIDALAADAAAKDNDDLRLHYILMKALTELGMYSEMLQGHIVSLNYATQYYLGSLPILFGALAAIVAW